MANGKIRLYRPRWKDDAGQWHESETWWMDVRNGNNRRWRLPGLSDQRQTEALARNVARLVALRVSGDSMPADMLKWLEGVSPDFRGRLVAEGLLDADRAGGIAPLLVLDAKRKIVGGHVADFLADLRQRQVSAMAIQTIGQRIRDVLTLAGAKWPRDLGAARIQAAITGLRTPTKKHPAGLSLQSLKHYVRAVRQFSRWLWREGRTGQDLLIGVKTYNPDTDKRRERRGFSAAEMAALLAYLRDADKPAPVRFGLSAPARAASYALAFASGLRRNEIRTLTAASFALSAEPPTVKVEAGYSKHRRQDVQPLPADVATILSDFLATADAERPFPLPDESAEMLAEDMAPARARWIAQDGLSDRERQDRAENPDFLAVRDSGGLVLDFHSFRHGYVTAICRAPVSPRTMMALARHSDPRLTMARYSRVNLADSAAALAFLPNLSAPPAAQAQAAALRMTGTDHVAPLPAVGQDTRHAAQGHGPQAATPRQSDDHASDGPGTPPGTSARPDAAGSHIRAGESVSPRAGTSEKSGPRFAPTFALLTGQTPNLTGRNGTNARTGDVAETPDLPRKTANSARNPQCARPDSNRQPLVPKTSTLSS
jgi:integrase